jgi:hypothetical protein
MEKICVKCKQVRSPEDFFSAGWKNGKQYFRRTCKKCYHLKKKVRIKKINDWYIDYKKNLCCGQCGCNDYRVLDFDHIHGEKFMNVSEMRGNGRFSKKKVLEEIAKCQVLCANCHRIKTLEGLELTVRAPHKPFGKREECGNERKCRSCKEFKEIKDFAKAHKKNVNGEDYYRWLCNVCYTNQKLYERYEKVLWFVEQKKLYKCVNCSNNDHRVLEFDHLQDKKFNIANGKSYSLDKMKKEMNKCQVLCVNCHRIKTWENWQSR